MKYADWILGSENNKYRTLAYASPKRKQFYNPVTPNSSHINEPHRHIGNDISCYSIVVSSNRCEFKKIAVNEFQTPPQNSDKLEHGHH